MIHSPTSMAVEVVRMIGFTSKLNVLINFNQVTVRHASQFTIHIFIAENDITLHSILYTLHSILYTLQHTEDWLHI